MGSVHPSPQAQALMHKVVKHIMES